MTLTTTASGSIGTTTYSWSYNQTSGTTLAGTSITNNTPSITFTIPPNVVFAGNSATTGDYSFMVQVVATDPGVASCNAVRTIIIWLNNVPPTCNLTITPITIS